MPNAVTNAVTNIPAATRRLSRLARGLPVGERRRRRLGGPGLPLPARAGVPQLFLTTLASSSERGRLAFPMQMKREGVLRAGVGDEVVVLAERADALRAAEVEVVVDSAIGAFRVLAGRVDVYVVGVAGRDLSEVLSHPGLLV